MPLFMVERNSAEPLAANRASLVALLQVNGAAGMQWLLSFLSTEKKKTYCLYEAPSAEALREVASGRTVQRT